MKTLVKNANIITCDGDKIIYNGNMGYEDKKIVFVGENIPDGFHADEVIDAKSNTVMPGLINAHSHVAMTILRSYSEGYSLQKWLTEKIFPIEDKLTADQTYFATLLGIAESVKFGTTCINDCYFFMDRAADAYIESGLNANISRCIMNGEEKEEFPDDYRIKEQIALYEKYDRAADDLIRVEVFPHAVYTCSFGYLKTAARLAEKYNMPIASHLCENRTEVSDCIAKYKKTPVEVYKEAGLLEREASFAHCVVLNDNDISLLKGHSVVHNPISNLKLGSGVADVIKYERNGINVALGTDGASSNNNLNMFEEMRVAALLMSGIGGDPSLVDPYKVIKMATSNGAKAMGRKAKGILKEGYDADYIIVDVSGPHHYPHHNIVNNIVYTAQGSDVIKTVAGGKVLYDRGEYKTIDIEKVGYEIMRIKKELF